jgi:uncharacterized protein with PIN domain
VRAINPREQLEEVLTRLDLYRSFKAFTRCLRSNEELEEAHRQSLNGRAPREYDQFWKCTQCNHIYWQGSHWRQMRGFHRRASTRGALSDKHPSPHFRTKGPTFLSPEDPDSRLEPG